MAGYWPSSFFACLWTETKSRSITSSRSINSQKRTRPISSHLDRTNLVYKGLIIWLLGKFCLQDTAGSPERARWLHLARSGSESQRARDLVHLARSRSQPYNKPHQYHPASGLMQILHFDWLRYQWSNGNRHRVVKFAGFSSFFPPNKYFLNLHSLTLLLPFLSDQLGDTKTIRRFALKGHGSIEVLHGSHVAWQEQSILFPMGKTVLSYAKHFHCSCHATWLPCETSIAHSASPHGLFRATGLIVNQCIPHK